MKNKVLYMKAIITHGREAQMIKIVEEFSELSAELCRHKLGKQNADKVVNEIADCGIMLDQADLIFGTLGMMDEPDPDPDPRFEYKPKTLIGDTLGIMGEIQLWLSEYGGKETENRIIKKHFKNLRVNFGKLAELFGEDEVENCRTFKLRRLELRLALGGNV